MELLVVVAIITIFIAIVISNFSQIKIRFALSRVTYKFEQDLRKAQDMAISEIQYKDSSGVAQPVSGYGVYADIGVLGGKKYIIYVDRAPGNQQYDALDYLVETIDFSLNEPGVIIKEINNVAGGKVSVNFNSSDVNTAITQLNPGQSNADVVFALESNLTETMTVSANNSGLIEVK